MSKQQIVHFFAQLDVCQLHNKAVKRKKNAWDTGVGKIIYSSYGK